MVDALNRRNNVTTIDTTNVGDLTAPTLPPTTIPVDALVTTNLRNHRVDLPHTNPGSFIDYIRESPTTRAVILGAGGLSSLFVGATSSSATAATVNVGTSATVANTGPKSIVYVGMNAEAQHEVDELAGRTGAAGITFIKPAKVQGQITHAGQTYDLNSPEGRLGFATALGLPADRASALASILEGTDDNARDEAGQLARTFREVEQNKRTIERIVLSGHSVGSGVWGDGNGYLSMSVIGNLALMFPKAAGQVQDLMMAACYSGGESKIPVYNAMFPNLKSVWAYDGSAPGSWSGAVPHINRWEKATRGEGGDTMSRTLATGTRKGENVAVWSAAKGYDNGKEKGPIETDRATYTTSHADLAAFQSGETAVESSQTGPLREHYNNIQRLLGRNDLPAAERTEMEHERDQVIRLLYFKNVGTMFQTTYKSEINSAFQSVGLTAPDFSTLSRKDAIAKVNELEAKLNATPSASAATKSFATRLHAAIIDLAPAQVPAAWL